MKLIEMTLRAKNYTLIKRFIESIQNNTELPVTVDESREMVRLYEAIASQI